MKCVDCIEKGVKTPQDAETYLIQDYESVRPLCRSCLQDYIEMEGEINIDSYDIKITGIGQEVFVQRLNETLKYLNEMNKRFSDRYFAAKKLGEKWSKTQPDPHADAFSDPPISVSITKKHGQELLEAIKW